MPDLLRLVRAEDQHKAWKIVKAKKSASGIDGITFEEMTEQGVGKFLNSFFQPIPFKDNTVFTLTR